MSTPPGWYDDRHGSMRWWDGAQWTDQIAPPAPEGAPAPEPVPDAAAAPRRSRLWILWVALGGFVLLVIVAAAILVPMLLVAIGSASDPAADGDEAAAVDTVELYDEAWREADCTAYQRATTLALRDAVGYPDCPGFVVAAEEFGDSVDEYELEVTSVQTLQDGTVSVSTRETYLAVTDENGQPFPTPEPAEDLFVYTVIPLDGGWVIDGIR